MRPLNRPMFRYGGPIKEGVMSGIREPKKNGGLSKQFNTGLVGDERYPKTDGREHHLAFLAAVPWLMNAARFGPAAWRGMKAARTFAPLAKNLGKWGRAKNILLPKKSITAPMAKGWEKAGFNIGAFMRSNPVTSFGIGSMIPQAGYAGYKVAKAAPGTAWEGAKRWADMVIPGDQSRWWKDKPPVKIDEKDKVTETNPWKEKYEALVEENKVPKKSDEEIRAEKLQKYRDIVDIKGMNSEAAANSLIEASRLINESQDFKGDIRSGSLINKIIQGASKAYDKPADMKRAIDTLIVKSEIQHDLNKEEKALANEVKRKQIEIYDKQLAGKTLNERIGEFRIKNQKNPSGNSLEGILLDIDIPVVDVADSTQVDAHIKNGGDEVSFMESIVEANVKEGKSVTPGVYVVKDKIIVIDENGNVKKKR